MKKTVTAAILLMSMLLSAVACGSDADSGKDTTAGGDTTTANEETSAEPTPLQGLERKDYGGRTFTILDANDNPGGDPNNPGDEENGEVVNDGLIERARYVEENLNVNLNFLQMSNVGGISAVRQSVLADEHSVDMMTGRLMNGMTSLALGECLTDINSLDGLSLDESWWASLMNESMNYKGRMYFTTGGISPNFYGMISAIYLNKDLLEKYSIDTDFYGLVNDGKWTIDVLAETVKDKSQDLDQDGLLTPENDFIGFAVQQNDFYAGAFLAGFGNKFCTIEGDDIKLSLSTEPIQTAIEKLQTIFDHITYTDQEKVISMFGEGRALAVAHLSATGKSQFRDMKEDFLLLPMPKWNETQPNYISYASTWAASYIAFPKTADTESAGDVAEMMARYSYQITRPKYYELILKQRGARDEESGKMLDIIFDGAYIDLNAAFNFGNSMYSLTDIIFYDAPMASTIAKATTAAEAAIETFKQAW